MIVAHDLRLTLRRRAARVAAQALAVRQLRPRPLEHVERLGVPPQGPGGDQANAAMA